MKRFIITEEEKNNIRKMYGFINEQTSLPVATSSAGATASYYDGPYFSRDDWDSHDFLNTIEIASAVLGMFPTPLSPLFWGISTIAGVADAKLYFDEKDPYMGTLMMALSVIPGGELAKIFKSSKAFQKIGVEGLKKLIKSYKSGNLKKESVKYLKEFTNIFKQPSVIKEVNKGIIETSLLTLKNNLKKKSLKYLINFLIYLNKFSKGVKNITFKVGGTVFGIDKLYLIIFADNEEYFNSRQKNEYRAIVNKFLNKTEYNQYLNNPEVREKLLNEINKQVDEIDFSKLKEGIGNIEISDKFMEEFSIMLDNVPNKKEEIPILRSVPTFQNLK
jgi:hypothetical protein